MTVTYLLRSELLFGAGGKCGVSRNAGRRSGCVHVAAATDAQSAVAAGVSGVAVRPRRVSSQSSRNEMKALIRTFNNSIAKGNGRKEPTRLFPCIRFTDLRIRMRIRGSVQGGISPAER